MSDWRSALRAQLFTNENRLVPDASAAGGQRISFGARKVLTLRHLVEIARAVGMPYEGRSADVVVSRLVPSLLEDGSLTKVNRGLFLNNCLPAKPTWADAARYIRSGAVVSLQTVLGDRGVLNNYVGEAVYAVIPRAPAHAIGTGARVSGGAEVPTLGPPFRFFTIAERIFYAGEEDDRWTATLDNPRCVDPDTVNEFSILQDWNRVATSEAALVHWLWLARSPRQPLSMPPPHDLDVGGLDLERLSRLAKDAGLEEEAERLVEECIRLSRSEDDGVEDGYVPSF